ncbi:hypothetical protein D5W64_13120 [Salmonella enterica subsp. enterica serovar Saintpaul]|nr:hypothetical protein [Salmonella enterica subsp. enterica serovar Saintpaul]
MSSFSDVEHYATIISGCEAFSHGNSNSPDARYALTVLQLHANDAGLYAGQEGFLDHVKKGAKNVKDWILALIKAIKNYIQERRGDTQRIKEKHAAFKKRYEEAKSKAKSQEKIAKLRSIYADVNDKLKPAVVSVREKAESIDEKMQGETFSTIGYGEGLKKTISELKSLEKAIEADDPIKVDGVYIIAAEATIAAMNTLNDKLNAYVARNTRDEEMNKIGKEVSNVQAELGGLNSAIITLGDKFSKAHEAALDEFMNSDETLKL